MAVMVKDYSKITPRAREKLDSFTESETRDRNLGGGTTRPGLSGSAKIR
jgi:hypothetical protein